MSASQVAGIMARLDAKTREMETAAEKGIVEVAGRIRDTAAELVPVESGRLHDSLFGGPDAVGTEGVVVVHGKHGPEAIIGTRVEYAATIEYEDVAYLRPAVHQHEQDFKETIAGHVRPVVDLP